MTDYHVPVLLEESLQALEIKPDGVYVDLTFGGGGHSRALLERLGPKGCLYAFDQDADARIVISAEHGLDPDCPRLAAALRPAVASVQLAAHKKLLLLWVGLARIPGIFTFCQICLFWHLILALPIDIRPRVW